MTEIKSMSSEERLAEYRASIRRTFQSMSVQALDFQSARIVGGIDREEVDREIGRRARGAVPCPDCRQGSMLPGDACENCSLSYEDLQAAAEFLGRLGG